MIVKLAAVKLGVSINKKIELSWRIREDSKQKDDPMFDFFTKLYDMLSQDYGKEKEFSIMIGGKSHRVNPKNYSIYNKTVKEEAERYVTKDYDKSDGGDKAVSAG